MERLEPSPDGLLKENLVTSKQASIQKQVDLGNNMVAFGKQYCTRCELRDICLSLVCLRLLTWNDNQNQEWSMRQHGMSQVLGEPPQIQLFLQKQTFQCEVCL